MTEIEPRRLRELEEAAANYTNTKRWVRIGMSILVGLILLVVGLVFVSKAVTPQLNLYKANTEKKAVIAEQRAQSEAAEFAAKSRVIQAQANADAQRIEAQGIRDSQEIISQTLTPEYLTWRYYEVLGTTTNQVVYLPTEAGLPITEARSKAEASD
jgi:hypothetical protein